MSIAGISSLSNVLLQGMQSSKKKRTDEDMRALDTALKTNDLAGAKKAFVALQTDMQSGSETKDKKSDLALIAKMLSNGTATGLPNLFSMMQNDNSNEKGFAQVASTDAMSSMMEKVLRNYAATRDESPKTIPQGQLSVKA